MGRPERTASPFAELASVTPCSGTRRGHRWHVSSTVSADVRAAVRLAANRVPLAVVSGATAAEITPVLEAAGLTDAFVGVISADEVVHGKPHPEGYLHALRLLVRRH